VSFLRAQGHPAPNRLPICILWHEVEIARARVHQEFVTQAILFQNAAASIMAPEEGGKAFGKLIKKLSDDGN
jgi:hypothetical protein